MGGLGIQDVGSISEDTAAWAAEGKDEWTEQIKKYG